MKRPYKIEEGYRHFTCECGYKWESLSRDMRTPSGEDCAACDEWVNPYGYESIDSRHKKLNQRYFMFSHKLIPTTQPQPANKEV